MSLFSECVICGKVPKIEMSARNVQLGYVLLDVKCEGHFTPKLWVDLEIDPCSGHTCPGELDEAICKLQKQWEEYNKIP